MVFQEFSLAITVYERDLFDLFGSSTKPTKSAQLKFEIKKASNRSFFQLIAPFVPH